jgi:hypothetical protein
MTFVTVFSFTAIRHRFKVDSRWSHVRGPGSVTCAVPLRQFRFRRKGKGGERVSHGPRSIVEPTPHPQGPVVGRQGTHAEEVFFRVVVLALLMQGGVWLVPADARTLDDANRHGVEYRLPLASFGDGVCHSEDVGSVRHQLHQGMFLEIIVKSCLMSAGRV